MKPGKRQYENVLENLDLENNLKLYIFDELTSRFEDIPISCSEPFDIALPNWVGELEFSLIWVSKLCFQLDLSLAHQ